MCEIVAPGDECCMKRRLIGLSSASGQLVRHDRTDHASGARPPRPALAAPSAARSAITASPPSSGSSCSLGLAVEGATIPFLGSLLSVHIFVGMLLLGPIALKLASTGYRMARYYTRGPEYVRLGPPAPLMRVLVAPVLVLSTLTLFGTGVAAARRAAPGHRAHAAQGELHRLVRGHGDPRPRVHGPRRPGRRSPTSWTALPRGRWLRIGLTLLASRPGVVIAVETYPLAHPWLNHHHWLGGDGG